MTVKERFFKACLHVSSQSPCPSKVTVKVEHSVNDDGHFERQNRLHAHSVKVSVKRSKPPLTKTMTLKVHVNEASQNIKVAS